MRSIAGIKGFGVIIHIQIVMKSSTHAVIHTTQTCTLTGWRLHQLKILSVSILESRKNLIKKLIKWHCF